MNIIKINFINDFVACDFIKAMKLNDFIRLSNSVLFYTDDLCGFIPVMVKLKGYTSTVTDYDKQIMGWIE